MSSEAEHPNLALGSGPEFDVIRAMLARWGRRATGIGDDAAVLHVPRGDTLVASVDTTLEGRHFRRDWLTPREIGYRAVTAALSDLAAMAARPLGILVALNLSARWQESLADLADGIADAVDAARTRILGGNVVASDALCLTTTVLGDTFAPIRRDGLQPGDRLYVTGRLGGPGAAVAAWMSGRQPTPQQRERFARPVARLREARWLCDRGATAAIDISDGLAADLGHLAAASGVGADVDLALLPLAAGVSDAMQAAASGEEYELIIGARNDLDTHEFEQAFGVPLTAIGAATSRGGGVSFRRGAERVAKPSGYDHLSG
ncbi:MAG TPA: thiamine-phosphate kinase [Gemmatimonadaceae bacterium]